MTLEGNDGSRRSNTKKITKMMVKSTEEIDR